MAVLETVSDYITDARTLLQDTISPYRYDDPSLLTAFNLTLSEGRRLRPDLFIDEGEDKIPYYTSVSGQDVEIEKQFRLAFVFGLCGHALARDQEDVQDNRSNTFMNVFSMVLTGKPWAAIQGGTPQGPGGGQK